MKQDWKNIQEAYPLFACIN